MLKSYLTPDRVKVVGFTNGIARYEEGSIIGNVLFIQDFMTLGFLKKLLSSYYNEPIKLCKGDEDDVWMKELLDAYTANWHDATVPVTSKEFKEAKARGFLPDHMEIWTNDHSSDPDTFYVSLWEMTFEGGCEYYSGRQIPVLFGVEDTVNEEYRTSFTPWLLKPWGFSFMDIEDSKVSTEGSYFSIGKWNGYKTGNPWNHSSMECVEGHNSNGNSWLEKRNITREEYKEVFHMFLKEYTKDGLVGLSDILTGEERLDKVLPKVEEWLDANCSNGHYSRWTSHGVGIYDDAEALVDAISLELYHREYNLL